MRFVPRQRDSFLYLLLSVGMLGCARIEVPNKPIEVIEPVASRPSIARDDGGPLHLHRGVLLPGERYSIVATTNARVLARHVDGGAWVETGEVLLELDDSSLEVVRREAELQYEQSRAQAALAVNAMGKVEDGEQQARSGLAEAQSYYGRFGGRILFKRIAAEAAQGMARARDGLVQVGIARGQVWEMQELSQQQLHLAHATRQLARHRFQNTHAIYAPAAGQLAQLTPHPGEFLQTGDLIGEIFETRYLRLVVWLSSEQVKALAPSSEAVFHPDGLSEPFAGNLHCVSPTADPQRRRFPAEVIVRNPHGRLRPGMFGSVSFPALDPGRTNPLARLTETAGAGVSTAAEDMETLRGLAEFNTRDGEVRLVNSATREGAILYLRHRGSRLQLAPRDEITLTWRPDDSLKFYSADDDRGDRGWLSLDLECGSRVEFEIVDRPVSPVWSASIVPPTGAISPVPPNQVFVNMSSRSGALLFLRQGEEQFILHPGESRQVESDPPHEFYTGSESLGWKLVPNGESLVKFRISKGGPVVWMAEEAR